MNCRVGCGACCIAPSISSPIPGMPAGKPAGQRCLHLSDAYRCLLFHDPRRPEVCQRFRPSSEVCGASREEALRLIADLEKQTTTLAS
ncbi:YkgJ family cysteine cluster protein [candidate division KSB3 bacterium]|uniref:YkgJ family cysteine cluster protein n=1 Tax=candidate division KSB3 bacterium TaxID=2044937 RepID=A0A9D5JWT8_9BACT|nr:YkgJ family cysteine cluster protein [candidate division KSB3 bacterium]MBD3325181.1 YkgJ family cysteine cluster protein [candidate division KSB3 bacterium]